MTIIQAIILGIIQGLTEFLPISSSGHLVLAPFVLGWELDAELKFAFDVLVQMGTLLAVIIYYWKDLWRISRITLVSIWRPNLFAEQDARLGIYLILATLPAVIVGLLFKDQIESSFSNPKLTAVFLLVTALLLFVAEKIGKRQKRLNQLNWLDAVWIGVFQALALFPGISRSGATITGGMTRNLEREDAAKFSFLMAVPVMLGAGVFEGFELFNHAGWEEFIIPLSVGFITAAIVGFFAIHLLLQIIKKYPMYGFSIYLMILSLAILVFGG